MIDGDCQLWFHPEHVCKFIIFVCVLLFSSWVTQSCIHMVLEFVSPESLQECLQLTSEFRCLPKSHHANKDKLEVG
jgi:lysine-specific demethylase 3